MSIIEQEAKSILRKYKRIDSWFISRYGMNLYRGCLHNCVYCDGRAEKYQVTGDFGKDIVVKINAVEVLDRELDPQRRGKPLVPGFIILGGGVGDSYQPVEGTYHLAHRTLELLLKRHWPVHILTKSTDIKNDFDLIKRVNEDSRALVSFSFSSTDDSVSKIFEPGVPSPTDRLHTISELSDKGIDCGMFLMPVIPFITDKWDMLEQTVQDAKKAGVKYIVFGGMTLKDGRQKKHFYRLLREMYPDLLIEYEHIYRGNRWGQAIRQYYQSLNMPLVELSKRYQMPLRIPGALFSDVISENDRVVVILDQIHYLLQIRGKRSPYGYAAHQIAQITTPLSQIVYSIRDIPGVGKQIEQAINEIIISGSSSLYEKLMYHF